MKPQRQRAQIHAQEAFEARTPNQPTSRAGVPDHPILSLQKTIGNRAVQRLISQHTDRSTQNQELADVNPLAIGEVVSGGVNSSSQSLDSETRAFMEMQFGFDFGDVRIHSNSLAAESSEAIDAHAYTLGQDIVFGEGEYSPNSSDGRKLLAHELTHVVQQASATGPCAGELSISEPTDEAEMAAEIAAEQVAGSRPTTRETSSHESVNPGTVHRDSDSDEDDTGGSDFLSAGLELAGDLIPGAGLVTAPVGAALGAGEAMTSDSTLGKIKGALDAVTGTVGLSAEMGGFSLLGGGGEAAAGSMALGALPEAAAAGELGTLGLAGPAAAVAGAGLAGVAAGTGMAHLADSSLTKTGAFGTDPDT